MNCRFMKRMIGGVRGVDGRPRCVSNWTPCGGREIIDSFWMACHVSCRKSMEIR